MPGESLTLTLTRGEVFLASPRLASPGERFGCGTTTLDLDPGGWKKVGLTERLVRVRVRVERTL